LLALTTVSQSAAANREEEIMAATVERYKEFDIEWVSMPSVGTCGHGIELHYDDGSRKLRVGFIEGYGWFHQRKGPCRVLTLSPGSEEWAEWQVFQGTCYMI
jgi:hypothetical protein